jgi:beta-N-acetylhexosaminidase
MKISVLLAAAAALISLSCGSPGVPTGAGAGPPAPDRLLPLDAGAARWVDSVLASLDARGRAAQLVMPWMSGRYAPAGSEEHERLLAWVRDGRVGGIITSIGAPVALADKLNRLQLGADVPLLIAADMEHGPGQRLAGGVLLPWGTDLGGGTRFPPVMAIAAAGDPGLAYELGRVTAQEARAVGVHLNFAPVADVNNNPHNPIINTRSYGEDPWAVAEFVAAHVLGLQEHGMLATAKHFPGHGDTAEDSHLVPLTLRIDAARADSVELVPFRAAIDAGVAAIMSAHIAFPALTDDPMTPATLSPRMLDSLLVRELGFGGLVVTDALDMGAIVARYGPADAAVLAVEAGADILLQPVDPMGVVDALVAAVEGGRMSQERIDRSARKVLEAKARLGLHRRRTVELAAVAERVGIPAHQDLAERIARHAVTLARDRDGLVPLDPARDRDVLAIVYSDDVAPFAARHVLATLAPRLPGLEVARLGPGEHPARLAELEARAAVADLVLFIADVRVRSGKGSVALEEPVAALVRAAAAGRPTVAVSLGSPYLLQQVPGVGTYVLGWGSDPSSQEAVARALLGDAAITGRLPTTIPPDHRVGEGMERPALYGASGPGDTGAALDRGGSRVEVGAGNGGRAAGAVTVPGLPAIDAAIEAAIAGGVTPGAAVAIGGRDGVLHLRGYGRLDHAPGAAATTPTTIYDLASLTKVVATTTAVMLLVEAGHVDLDHPLHAHLSAWPRGGWRDQVTIRRLLTHTAGLLPFVRFWHPSAGALRGQEVVVDAIARLPAAYAPGARSVYSDLGFILLGAMVEEAAGAPLDRYLRPVWDRLGMDDTGFRATEWAALDRIAPTEVDTHFRHTHVHGVVHDENAFAMGGVAGHAGLFSTAADLATFARQLMMALDGEGSLAVAPSTAARFTTREPGTPRTPGWNTGQGAGTIARAFSARAFGETGFTGTSLWLDPEADLFVILLTNRVNPTRDGTGIAELRRTVHELALHARSSSELRTSSHQLRAGTHE